VPEVLGNMNVQVRLHKTGPAFHIDAVSHPLAEHIHWASDAWPDRVACAACGFSAYKC